MGYVVIPLPQGFNLQLKVDRFKISGMGDNKAVTVSDKALVAKVRDFSVKRAKSFKVKSEDINFEQYAKTIRAYALAGMPFEHIANAGDFLGDEVEKKEVNAPFQNKNQSKIGEVAEDDSQILAWARGDDYFNGLTSTTSSRGIATLLWASLTSSAESASVWQ